MLIKGAPDNQVGFLTCTAEFVWLDIDTIRLLWVEIRIWKTKWYMQAVLLPLAEWLLHEKCIMSSLWFNIGLLTPTVVGVLHYRMHMVKKHPYI